MSSNKRFYLSGTVFSIIIFFGIIFYLTKDNNKIPTISTPKIESDSSIDLNEFGFKSDSLNRERYSIKKGETLSNILQKYKLNQYTVNKIIAKAKDIFDLEKIHYKNYYYTFTGKNDSTRLYYLVYEKNPVNYVVISLKDSISVYTWKKKVRTRLKTAAGIIQSSLYKTVIDNNINPELAIRLSDIYAWQIDFFKIQRGDYFKVLYNEEYVDNKPIGIKNILGANFNHNNENYFAIGFKENNRFNFYDQNGKSLRKAFLKAPLKYSRISSRFTNRRYHPILNRYLAHRGVDYAAPLGTPVRSVGDGIITGKGFNKFNGNFIKIRHNNIYSTEYLHLSGFAKNIRKGKKVLQGQIIGYVGSTGLATGPHLDFRFFKNNYPINPVKIKSPPTKSVDNKLMDTFVEIKDRIITQLDSIHITNKVENSNKVSAG